MKVKSILLLLIASSLAVEKASTPTQFQKFLSDSLNKVLSSVYDITQLVPQHDASLRKQTQTRGRQTRKMRKPNNVVFRKVLRKKPHVQKKRRWSLEKPTDKLAVPLHYLQSLGKIQEKQDEEKPLGVYTEIKEYRNKQGQLVIEKKKGEIKTKKDLKRFESTIPGRQPLLFLGNLEQQPEKKNRKTHLAQKELHQPQGYFEEIEEKRMPDGKIQIQEKHGKLADLINNTQKDRKMPVQLIDASQPSSMSMGGNPLAFLNSILPQLNTVQHQQPMIEIIPLTNPNPGSKYPHMTHRGSIHSFDHQRIQQGNQQDQYQDLFDNSLGQEVWHPESTISNIIDPTSQSFLQSLIGEGDNNLSSESSTPFLNDQENPFGKVLSNMLEEAEQDHDLYSEGDQDDDEGIAYHHRVEHPEVVVLHDTQGQPDGFEMNEEMPLSKFQNLLRSIKEGKFDDPHHDQLMVKRENNDIDDFIHNMLSHQQNYRQQAPKNDGIDIQHLISQIGSFIGDDQEQEQDQDQVDLNEQNQEVADHNDGEINQVLNSLGLGSLDNREQNDQVDENDPERLDFRNQYQQFQNNEGFDQDQEDESEQLNVGNQQVFNNYDQDQEDEAERLDLRDQQQYQQQLNNNNDMEEEQEIDSGDLNDILNQVMEGLQNPEKEQTIKSQNLNLRQQNFGNFLQGGNDQELDAESDAEQENDHELDDLQHLEQLLKRKKHKFNRGLNHHHNPQKQVSINNYLDNLPIIDASIKDVPLWNIDKLLKKGKNHRKIVFPPLGHKKHGSSKKREMNRFKNLFESNFNKLV